MSFQPCFHFSWQCYNRFLSLPQTPTFPFSLTSLHLLCAFLIVLLPRFSMHSLAVTIRTMIKPITHTRGLQHIPFSSLDNTLVSLPRVLHKLPLPRVYFTILTFMWWAFVFISVLLLLVSLITIEQGFFFLLQRTEIAYTSHQWRNLNYFVTSKVVFTSACL